MATRRSTIGVVGGGLDDLPLPEPGLVRLRAVAHDLGVVAELNGTPLPTGYAVHAVTERKRRVGITSYSGRQPLSLRLPLLLDRWSERASVEREVRVLEQLLGLDALLTAPPQVIVEGFGIPHSYSRAPHLRWVLSGDPEWGDDIRYRGDDGHRSYVPVTVLLLQYERPEKLAAPGADDTAATGRRQYVTVPRGSQQRTLRQIARRRKVRWQTLRHLNPRLPGDPDKHLPAGTKVRVR